MHRRHVAATNQKGQGKRKQRETKSHGDLPWSGGIERQEEILAAEKRPLSGDCATVRSDALTGFPNSPFRLLAKASPCSTEDTV
jgi:hypothetical protein